MTLIKICGITNPLDALAAKSAGADFLGIIQVPNTPRFVGDEQIVREIGEDAGSLPIVGVFKSLAAAEQCPWKALFQYFQVYEMDIDAAPSTPTIFCLRVHELEIALSEPVPTHAEILLLDAYHPDKLGGAGQIFDWTIFNKVREHFQRSTFLAGGLKPENVQDAVQLAHPFGVDVSSGVEASPGQKDHEKLHQFVRSVRAADVKLKETIST